MPKLPAMTTREALQTLISIASSWGDNAEEGLPNSVINDIRSDEVIDLDVLGLDEVDADTFVQCRELFRAITRVQQIMDQRGTEVFDRTAPTLCDLCDVVVDG